MNRLLAAAAGVCVVTALSAAAEEPGSPEAAAFDLPPSYGLPEALDEAEWRRMEAGVDRGLAFLARRQEPDGAFHCPRVSGQPAITSLAVMAFLSAGHRPGEGPYGAALDRAVRYALSCQHEDGVYSLVRPVPPYVKEGPSHTAVYNHAITGTMLCEAYGLTDGETAALIRASVPKALGLTRAEQLKPKGVLDRGGWRYLWDDPVSPEWDSDLSVTAWQLTFYRSARNAEFPVPARHVDEAVAFVRRCHVGGRDPGGVFTYHPLRRPTGATHAMTGAGALSLALAGLHDDPMAAEAGDWLRRHPVRRYEEIPRFHYAAFYTSQAMAQLGGDGWREYYPPLVRAVLAGQRPDGGWTSRLPNEAEWGEAYLASMCVLSLTPAYQLLPIYQR